MHPGVPVLSMRLAVLMVSPNRQKRGMRVPTTPDTTGPLQARGYRSNASKLLALLQLLGSMLET